MSKRELKLVWLVPMMVISQPAYAAEYLTVAQAQKVLIPEAKSFVEADLILTDEQVAEIKKLSGVRQRSKDLKVWRALGSDSHLLGWFIVDDVIGKHEYITYAAAISSDGKVLGIEVLSYRETHGGQVRDASWRKRFVGKSLKDPFVLDVDMPNISGATLSCRNIVDGVKRLLVVQSLVLKQEK